MLELEGLIPLSPQDLEEILSDEDPDWTMSEEEEEEEEEEIIQGEIVPEILDWLEDLERTEEEQDRLRAIVELLEELQDLVRVWIIRFRG